MKKLLNITLVLMILGFTSTVFAEIMEDIRVECKDLDGKKMCKPIKVGAPVDEGFLIQAAASGSITDASPATANTGAPKGMKNGSHVAILMPKSKRLV
jgi:hypothetical protein